MKTIFALGIVLLAILSMWVSAQEGDVLYSCPMMCIDPRHEPGACPICGMDLVAGPSAESVDEGMVDRRITLSESGKRLAEVQTVDVERTFVDVELRLYGQVDYDETQVKSISAWVPGRLETLYVDYTGVHVTRGDPLVEIYSPGLIDAQSDLVLAFRDLHTDDESSSMRQTSKQLLAGARERLRLLGLTDEQITTIEEKGQATSRVTIRSPITGTVIAKEASEGQYVEEGTLLYTVADLTTLWVTLDAYEMDLPWLRVGQAVRIKTKSYGDERFSGEVSFINPVLDPHTRTVDVRVVVDNADLRLKPNLFVDAIVYARVGGMGELVGEGVEPALVVPASAVLLTGKRSLVYVEVPDQERPTYEGVEVELGPRAGDQYVVRKGLLEGQRVVTHGNFNIDSALQLMRKPSMMNAGKKESSNTHQHNH